MRRLTTSLILGIFALTAGSLTAAAEESRDFSAAAQLRQEASAASFGNAPEFRLESSERLELRVQENAALNARTAPATRRGKTKVAPLGVAAVTNGYYVGSYSALSSSSFPGGSTMQVEKDAEGDSISIKSFWNGCTVRALYDAASSTVRIPRQYIMTDESLGALDLAVANSNGAPDYNAEIVGTVLEDGTIDLSEAWWAVYVQSGTNKDKFVGAYYNMVIRKPTGTMTWKNTSGQQSGYYVVIEQAAKNLLKVTNIFNRGLEIEIELNRDRSAVIDNQTAMINSSGAWTMIRCVEFNDAGNLTKYSPIITIDPASATNTTLKWTDWSLLCTQASAYAGCLTDAVLTSTTGGWTFPELSVSEFEGEGTAENPFLIKSLDHLILLSDKVNGDTEYNGGSGNFTYTRTYLGKHFALANDIDMEGYRFDAIGNVYKQRFAGSLDGRGHKISGLVVDGGGTNYAGLFGMCDTLSVLKNIVIDSPKVTSNYYSAGALAAFCVGSVENITVINPQVTGAASGTGAVAGIVVGSMRDCKVIEGTVMASGFLGGAVGEVHGGISNCSVTGTKVYITGASSPAGGVAGNILGADASCLSFSGLLSYANLSSDSGQIIGGVVGTLQNVSLEKSFSSGVIRGYSNDSQLGGVVGILSSGRVENCYSSGFMQCYTRMGGGIVGYVQIGSSKKTPRVANSYTSATVMIETYQYDRNRCSEVVGLVADGVEAELENLYYDRQVTDFKSTRFGASTAELTSAAGPKGFSSDVWNFTEGAYPRIKESAGTESAMYSASAVDMKQGDSFKKLSANTPLSALGETKFFFAKGTSLTTEGHYARIIDNKMLEIGTEFGADTLYVVNGSVQTFHIVNIAPIPFEGEGSEEAPFLIKSKEDMIALYTATTVKKQTFPGIHFAVTNDIDMEHTPDFDGICSAPTDAANKFQGVFDGQGHTIDNLYFNRMEWSKVGTDTSFGTINTTASRSYGGIFGRLGEDGVLKNLNVGAGSKMKSFYGTSAAFVGSLDGRIENCRNYADITGYSCWIGGIAGMINKGGVITDCYNAGDITTGYANVGGIAGTSNGLIDNCANTGNITAKQLATNYANQRQRAGGILGSSNGSAVTNCVNYGTVFAELNNVGGIVSSMDGSSKAGSFPGDSIANCLNLGNAYCGNKATVGSVLGLKGTSNVKNVYFDAQTIGIKAGQNADVENISGIESSVLISGEPLAGLSADKWNYTAGIYPALAAYAAEPKVAAARKVKAIAKSGETFTELYNDVTLEEGAEWSLKTGDAFKIEAGRLIVPKNVTKVVADTLIAINEMNVRRPIFVQTLPAMPLSGDGTEASPYLISNTDEWNSLATYIDNTGKTLEEKFVKVTSDLDFTDKTISRIGADGVTSFWGDLNGDNHTVKGFAIKSAAASNCGIFGTVGDKGSIRNITFEGTVNATHAYSCPVVDNLNGSLVNVVSNVNLTTTAANAAGVVGKANTGAILDKVVFSGSISSKAANIGGLVASTTAGVTFRNCEFTGKIEQTGSYTKATAVTVGGFVSSAAASTFENCRSAGEITLATPAWAHTVAGFIGNALGAKGNGLYSFTECVNSTSIDAAGKVAGFIAGGPTSSSAAANAQYVFTDCHNEGDIISESAKSLGTGYPTAGIAAFYTPGSSFTRCYNTGIVISNTNTYAAGIAAYIQGTPGSSSTPATVEFTDCYNEGPVIADGNQGGGICGYVSGAVTLTGCYNTGNIEGTRMVGGITSAFAGSGPKMINCYNTGDITVKTDRAGGLIAWGSPTNGLVEGCWNAGTVSSLSEIQSTKSGEGAHEVAGLAANSGAEFKDCYNVGLVKGLSAVGGLVGTPAKAKTKLTNCYNAGVIEAPADTCGSILGISISNGKLWAAGNAIDNCYYLDINKSDNDTSFDAKPVTRKELASLDLGEGYEAIDHTHPVIKAFASHPTALFHAAELVLADNDTYDKVTQSFNVGGSPTVVWSSDCPALEFNGPNAEFKEPYTGPVKVTASVGDLSKHYELNAAAISVGVNAVLSDDANVISRRYYTTDGIEVARPMGDGGEIYIIVETLKDGSRRVVKTNVRK